jgi:hypothetical protein
MSIARLIASTKSVIVFDFRSDTGLQYIVFLTGVPSMVQPGNQYNIQGYVEFISNPDNIPFTAISLTVFFDLNVLPQSFIINPNINGNFYFILQVAESVQPEDEGLLQLRDTPTSTLLYEANIGVIDYPASLSVSPSAVYYDEIKDIEIDFEAQPNSHYTIISSPSLFTALTGILDNQGNGLRYFSAPSTTPPGSYLITGSFAQNQQRQDSFQILAEPNLTAPLYGRKYNVVGTTDYLQGTVSLGRPGWVVGFKLIWNGTTYLSTIGTTTGGQGDVGLYSIAGSWKFPLSASGQTMTQEYIRYSPLPVQTASVTYEVAIFLNTHTIVLSPVVANSIYYARPSGGSLTISSLITVGYSVNHTITQPSPLTTLTNTTSPDSPITTYSLTPEGVGVVREGARNVTGAAEFHLVATASFSVLYGIELIDYGFTTQNNITLEIYHKPNTLFTILVNSATYTFTSGSTSKAFYNITTSTLAIGNNPVTLSQANGATHVDAIVYYPLSSTSTFTPLYTNNTGVQNLVFLLSPKLPYTVTVSPFNLSVTGFSLPKTGTNSVGLNPPWTPSGDYTITISSPYDDPVVITGNHKGAIRLADQTKVQGDPETTAIFRAANSEAVTFQVASFLPTQTFTTDGNGYFTVPIPAIPVSIFAPSSYVMTGEQSNPIRQDVKSLRVERAVNVSIEISNLPTTLPSNHLFTNSLYMIGGATPNGIPFTLSATGTANAAISNILQASNVYTAQLATLQKVGGLTLTITALYQPPASKSYTVVAPLTLTTTDTEVYNTDPPFTLTASHVNNVLTYIRVSYRSSGGTQYKLQTFSGVSNSNGDYILSFNPNQINQPGTLFVEAYSSASSAYIVSLTLNAYYQDVNPTPPPPLELDNTQTTISQDFSYWTTERRVFGEPYVALSAPTTFYTTANDLGMTLTGNATAIAFTENTDPATRSFISFKYATTATQSVILGAINSLEHTVKFFISFSAFPTSANVMNIGFSGYGGVTLTFVAGNKPKIQTSTNAINNPTITSNKVLVQNKIYCMHFIIRRNDTGVYPVTYQWWIDGEDQGKLEHQVNPPASTTNAGQTYVSVNILNSAASHYNFTFWKRALTVTEITSQKNAAGVYYPHRVVLPEDVFWGGSVVVFNYARNVDVFGFNQVYSPVYRHTSTVPSSLKFSPLSVYPTKISNYLRFNTGQFLRLSQHTNPHFICICFKTSYMSGDVRVLVSSFNSSRNFLWTIMFTGADRLSFLMAQPASGGTPVTTPAYVYDLTFSTLLINQWCYLVIDSSNIASSSTANYTTAPQAFYLQNATITPTLRIIPRTSDVQAGDYFVTTVVESWVGAMPNVRNSITINNIVQFGNYDLFVLTHYNQGSPSSFNSPATQVNTTPYLDSPSKRFAWDCMMAGRPELFRAMFPNHPRSFQDQQYI